MNHATTRGMTSWLPLLVLCLAGAARAEYLADLPWLGQFNQAISWISFILSAVSVACCGMLLLTFIVFKVIDDRFVLCRRRSAVSSAVSSADARAAQSLRSFALELVCCLAFCIMMALLCFNVTFEVVRFARRAAAVVVCDGDARARARASCKIRFSAIRWRLACTSSS